MKFEAKNIHISIAPSDPTNRIFLNYSRLFPFSRWIHLVNRNTIKADLLAGLTGAVVALPQGVAFAAIAGMPPQYGLYAGMVPAMVAAFFGSSWHLVSGPTTAASIVLYSVLAAHAEPGSAQYVSLALTLTFLVGVIQIIMGLARLGTLVNFISHSVVTGFTAGAAILIATKQVKNFFGLPIPRGASFTQTWEILFNDFSQVDIAILGVSLFTLLLGIAVKAWFPKQPYMIIAMLGGSAVAVALQFSVGISIPVVGALPSSLPPLSVPHLSLDSIQEIASGVLAVTLLALTEAVSIARALSARSGQHVDGNQEFIGQGMSNLIGAFFSSYVATGSFNRSGVNYSAGAKTPMAAMLAGFFLLILVLLIAPLGAYLPNAAMAGILFMVAWGLIDFDEIISTLKNNHHEAFILVLTFSATLFLSLEEAIILGVMLSLGLYLSRTSHPQVRMRVPNPNSKHRKFTDMDRGVQCPQLRLVRIDGSIYFGATSYIREILSVQDSDFPNQKHIAIIGSSINFVDKEGAHFLQEEAERRRQEGGCMYFIRLKDTVYEQFDEYGILKSIGGKNIFESKGEAIPSIIARLDKTICETCQARIFLECANSQSAD
ncbi:sulfate permease, SulP family [Gammaproteobacteria bacterium]